VSKKAKTYLLIVIIILSWGYVGYKIYTALQGDDEQELSLDRPEIKKIDEAGKEDSIVLLLNYPDPFLKDGNFSKENKSNSSVGHSSSPKSERPIPAIKLKPEIATPIIDVKYVGLVKNNDKGTSTAMISINGKSSFVREKEIIEGFSVLEITKNSIKLKKGKETLTINK
jgi:hypothetical protein